MFYLLFILYLVVFCWLITRIRFFRESGIGTRYLISLFLVRIVMSLISCYFNLYYLPVSDALGFHMEGINEYNLLFHHPGEYFLNIFQDTYQNGYSGFFDSSNSYWNNTKNNLLYKMLSVFDIFSGKNFFINTLFYNFLVFFGPVALYKVFINVFPTAAYSVLIAVFLLPSALFFSSVIHRDGLILLSLSMVLYHLFMMMEERQISWKRSCWTGFFMIVILVLRGYVFISLLPALLAWILARHYKKYAFIFFAGIYAISAVLFFCSGYISAKTNLPQYVCNKQLAFIEVSRMGASTIDIKPLYPNFRSFLNNAPEALDHALLRPYVTEVISFVYLPFVMENLLIQVLFLLFLFARKKMAPVHPLVYFCFFFSFTIFLVTGYTVPIIGAIVRYRSIYLIFLLLPVICLIDWIKLRTRIYIKIRNIYYLF